jgi:hypothetical protein
LARTKRPTPYRPIENNPAEKIPIEKTPIENTPTAKVPAANMPAANLAEEAVGQYSAKEGCVVAEMTGIGPKQIASQPDLSRAGERWTEAGDQLCEWRALSLSVNR